jgi:ABC-2 type transport system permease protein
MNLDRTLAIAGKIVLQLLHDRRSIALVIGAPIIVMSLVGFSFSNQPEILNRIAPALIGTFAFFFTFLLTGITFLRERTQGTLERMLVTPVGRIDILIGYLLGFIPFAAAQSAVIVTFTVLALDITHQGSLLNVAILLLALVVAAVNLGIFISIFAKNEFQITQFLPIVLAPQVFLSGIILPIEQMPSYFQLLSRIMPLRYAVDGLQSIMLRGSELSSITGELTILLVFALALLILASFTIRRA